MTLDQKLDFLEELKVSYPNMRVHSIRQPLKTAWANDKLLKDLTQQEKEEVNLRKTRPNEIIFDVEDPALVGEARAKLDSKMWTYYLWWTGSRGFHISVTFTNLSELSEDIRNRVRKYLILEIGTDIRLASENQFVALEYAPHMKTLSEKYLFDTHTEPIGENKIPQDIIDYCQSELKLSKQIVNLEQKDEDFKDWHMKDPYLKYVCENQIPDGQEKNNILFKNFAVALVKTGLPSEDIDEIVKLIILRCPGHTVGEFNGWLQKARLGEIKEYNKAEIVKWAIKYDHPVMYELSQDINMQSLMDIKNLWDALWNSKIARQEVWKDLAFYNLLGTVLDERIEDLRIHTIFSSYSGTGKDEGLNIIEKVLKSLNYETSRPSSSTDRTLVGAVNPYAVEYNTKNGIIEGQEIEDARGKKKVGKKEVEEGDLATKHWMAFGESESVFKPSAHNRLIQVILRQAMDKNRQVEKGVSGRNIRISTNTSFVLVTYTMNDTVYKILNNGLFQRAIFYDKDLSDEDDDAILDHINNHRFNNNIRKNFPEDQYYREIKDRLESMKKWYVENKSQFTFFDKCEKYTKRLWEDYKKEYSALPSPDKAILNSIIRRSSVILYKLAILNATWKRKNLIGKDDIDECFKLLTTCIDSIKRLVVKFDKEAKEQAVALYLLKEQSMTAMELHRGLESQLSMKSPNQRVKLIKKLVLLNLISEFQKAQTKYLSITDKGRTLIE